jgi:hypothetical protein
MKLHDFACINNGVKILAHLRNGRTEKLTNFKVNDGNILNDYYLDYKGKPIPREQITHIEYIAT